MFLRLIFIDRYSVPLRVYMTVLQDPVPKTLSSRPSCMPAQAA